MLVFCFGAHNTEEDEKKTHTLQDGWCIVAAVIIKYSYIAPAKETEKKTEEKKKNAAAKSVKLFEPILFRYAKPRKS